MTVTFGYCVETSKYILKRFLLSGSHTILVLPYRTLWKYSDGDPPPNGGVECRWSMNNCEFRPSRFISEIIQGKARKYTVSTKKQSQRIFSIILFKLVKFYKIWKTIVPEYSQDTTAVAFPTKHV